MDDNNYNEHSKIINDITNALDMVLMNKKCTLLDLETIPDSIRPIYEKLNTLINHIDEVNSSLVALSIGNLDVELPPRNNYLAGPLKQLFSNLIHLTWQTERIANGEYGHKVNFMGDFSNYFNSMTSMLEKRENQLNSANQLLETVFNHIDPLLIIDANDRTKGYYINKSAKDLFNINEPLNEEKLYDLKAFSESSSFAKNLLFVKNINNSSTEICNTDIDRWFNINISPLKWTEKEDVLILFCIDITVQKNREMELQKDAHTDSLTGIFNRYAFDIALNDIWKQASNKINIPISVMIIDIDNFKVYNDTFGHLQGDVCLRAVAQCINNSYPKKSSIITSRFGGEEFMVLMCNTDVDVAFKLAETIRKNIEALEVANIVNVTNKNTAEKFESTKVTVSIGVSSIMPSTTDKSKNDLLALADKALYISKANGKNTTTKLSLD